MTQFDVTSSQADAAHDDADIDGDGRDETSLIDHLPRLGVFAWSFIGIVVTIAIIATALAAVSEIVLPLTFAAVLAICFEPLAAMLKEKGLKPTLAAGIVVLGLFVLMILVVVATVRGVVDQADEISASADAAVAQMAEWFDPAGLDVEVLDATREAVEGAESMVTTGALSGLVSGIGSIAGLVGGIILGTLIMYYLLKDGAALRRSLVHQVSPSSRDAFDDFLGEASRILRDYGRGRTIMSALVSVVIGAAAFLLGLPLVITIVVVNFVGGYIPYVGAFLGGGLAVIVALGDGGFPPAAIMLVVVLASNLALENFIEPKVMGRTLDIHPLTVLVVTALGGLIGGIVGLILAVPATVIAGNALTRLRSRGVLRRVAAKAQPTVERFSGRHDTGAR